jgi:hypothetical protein
MSVGGSLTRFLCNVTQWIAKTVKMIPSAKEPSAMPISRPMLMVVRLSEANGSLVDADGGSNHEYLIDIKDSR